MENQLKEALKLINDKCKQEDYYASMNAKSLSKRIETIHSSILWYIDSETVNYYKTQSAKQDPERSFTDHRIVELSKKEVENSIQNMQWMIRDLESCISHLKLK